MPGGLCVVNTHRPNSSACKVRLGCGLCGRAARPAPLTLKHARATQTSTHRATVQSTHTCHTKERQHSHHTHKGKNNTTERRRRRHHRCCCCCLRERSERLICVWCKCWRSFVCVFLALCGCFISSVSAGLCGARVLDDVRRGPGSAKPAKPNLALQVQN